MAAGMDEFLTKPVEMEKVFAVLVKYCASKSEDSKGF